MTKELATTSPMRVICNTIKGMKLQIENALKGTTIDSSRFIAITITNVQLHPSRDDLEAADRLSLYNSILKAASDGLMLDGREAALFVNRHKKVEYRPMVQGLVKLARKSGEIVSISSEVVYSNDEFKLGFNIDGVDFFHLPCWTSERGDPILVWATVKLTSGEVLARAYSKKRIDSIATRSGVPANYNPKIGKDWEEWWRKAAIRNILKYAPKSTSLEQALQKADDEFDLSNESVSYEPTQADPINDAPKTETRASAVIKKKAEPEADNIIDLEPTNFEEEEIPV